MQEERRVSSSEAKADANATPYARYAASQFDNIDTTQHRSYLNWSFHPAERTEVESTLYYSTFKRNWYKIDHISTDAAPVLDSSGRIAERKALHSALLKPELVSVLKGEASGSIGVKANRREYESYGWQNRLTQSFSTGEVDHRLSFGLRLHKDSEDRLQEVDVFSGNGSGDFASFRQGVPGEEADRLQETFATALYIEDEIRHGAWLLKPGFRYEYIDQSVDDKGKKLEGDFNVWAAGVGMNYELNAELAVFGGVYRGISIPGPSSRLSNDIAEEESISYELGLRHASARFSSEIAGFFTDYRNLVGTDTGLGLGGGSNLNAGEAEVYGVEFMVAGDLNTRQETALRLPAYFSATYTQAELKKALASGGGGNIYAGGEAGAALPYVPEWKLAFGIGVEQGRFDLRLDGTWVDKSFGTAQNLDAPDSTSRQGRIDDVMIFDLSAGWQISSRLEVFAGVRNLFDETYLTSRIPEGPRNGAPRTAYVGLEWVL